MKGHISWQAWLLIAWPYTMFLLLWGAQGLSARPMLILLGIWVLLQLLVCGLNLRRASLDRASGALQGMVVKLALIPFYAAVFLVGLLTWAAPPLVLGLFLLDSLLLLTSSAYGLAAAWRAYRRAELSLPWLVLLSGGHLLFAVDVPCSIVLFLLTRRKPR